MYYFYSLSFSRNNSINVIVTSNEFKGSLSYELFQDGLINPEISLSFKGGKFIKNFPHHNEVASSLLPVLSVINLRQFFDALGYKVEFFIEEDKNA